MGLERSNFEELEGMNDEESSEEELTDEEIQLKREEKEESGGEWELNSGTSEKRTEFTDEWSEEDKQLQREERSEEDDWWCKIGQIATSPAGGEYQFR
jgi:hypothetical protein